VTDQIPVPKIASELKRIDEIQEALDDRAITDEEHYDKYERKYQAYEAIKMVLLNNQKALNNQRLADKSSFKYVMERGHVVAAAHMVFAESSAELKWLGSVSPGQGRELLELVKHEAQQKGIANLDITSKFGSSEYYKKLGAKQITDHGEDPITGTGDKFSY